MATVKVGGRDYNVEVRGDKVVVDGHEYDIKVREEPAFATVTAGGVHSCARTRGGQVWCWGRNLYGQIGDGSNTTRETPSRVAGPAFTAVNATGAHTCAVTGDDETWCWGYNVEGQLGDGTRSHLSRPTRVTLPGK